MAPKFKKPDNPDAWWQMAYDNRPEICVQYSLDFGKDTLVPGTKFKVKNLRGVFKFRCLVHNVTKDVTWVDAIDCDSGEWRSFRIDKIRNIVRPKKSRAKKVAAK